MGRVITAPGVLTNVQGQIDHVTDMYDDIKNNNLKPLTITLDPVSNANGAVSVVTEDPRVTEDMKAISIEVGTPEVFKAPISVTTASGTVTLACENATGTSTVKVTLVKTSPVEGGADYPPAVTSTEFDILADRIGSLGELDTTDQSSIVNAVNEVVGSVDDVNSKINYETAISDCDSVTEPGTYFVNANALNSPSTAAGRLVVMKSSASAWGTQIFAGNDNSPNIYVRSKKSSGFSDWEQLVLAKNEKYNRNETITLGGTNAMYAGRVGWAGKEIWITVPLGKPISSDVPSAAITSLGGGTIYACTANAATQITFNSITQKYVHILNDRCSLSLRLMFDTAPLSINDGIVNLMMNTSLQITFG